MLFRLDFKHRCGHELKRALNTLSPIAERANSPQRQMHTRFNQTKIGASACADVPMRTRYMSHKPEPIRRHHVPYCPCALYLASVASLAGRHQDSFSTYQSMVALSPSAKSVCAGLQPSSRWSFVLSMA